MFLVVDVGYALQRLWGGERQMSGTRLHILHLAMKEKVTPDWPITSPHVHRAGTMAFATKTVLKKGSHNTQDRKVEKDETSPQPENERDSKINHQPRSKTVTHRLPRGCSVLHTAQ